MKYTGTDYTYITQAAQALVLMSKGSDDSVGIVGFASMDRDPSQVYNGRIRVYKPILTPSEISERGRSYVMSDMSDSTNGMIGYFQADAVLDSNGDYVVETFKIALYESLPYVTNYLLYKYVSAIYTNYEGALQALDQYSVAYSDITQYNSVDIESDVKEWMKAGFLKMNGSIPTYQNKLTANTNDYTKRYLDGEETKYLWYTAYASTLATGFIVYPISGSTSQFGWSFYQAGKEIFSGQMNFPASWGNTTTIEPTTTALPTTTVEPTTTAAPK